MEGQMKINGEAIRAVREQKSWSQEHLANASGLSVRTVQRVEVEGVASAETRLALAAALGVPVADLIPAPPSTNATVSRRFPLWGWIAFGAVLSVVVAAVLASGLGLGANALTIPYSTFLGYVESGSVEKVTIDNAAGEIRAVRGGEQLITSNPEWDNTALIGLLEEHDVRFEAAAPQEQSFLLQVFISVLPILLLIFASASLILLLISASIHLMRRTGAKP